MALTGSTRDLFQAIHAFYAAPQTPLPDELTRVIELYLDRHAGQGQAAAASAERLQEGLVAAFDGLVRGQGCVHQASFVALLRRLRPALQGAAHVLPWWDRLMEPALTHMVEERAWAADVIRDVGDFLVPEEEDGAGSGEAEEGGTGHPDGSGDGATGSGSTDERASEGQGRESVTAAIGQRLVQKWMDVCEDKPLVGQGQAGRIRRGGGGGAAREKPVQDVLLVLGTRRPMDFFGVLNDFFVCRAYRTRAATLLCEFVRSEPPHLHRVIQSPLFDSLLRCLQHDTSTTVVSLALTALVMLLPNMPSSSAPLLPTLFNIYARLLFWDREPLREAAAVGSVPGSWEQCVFAAETDGMALPHLAAYFTILYGLYPLNFMDYIRKPQRYLRHAHADDAGTVEVQPSEIRDRSEPFRRCHLLHPNFYTLTIESEKTDFGRWLRSSTADVVAECMALHVAAEQPPPPLDPAVRTHAAPSRPDGHNGPPDALLGGRLSPSGSDGDGEAERHTLHSRSPTLSPLLSPSASRSDIQGMIESSKAIKSGLHRNDSVLSLAFSHRESLPERPTSVLRAEPVGAAAVTRTDDAADAPEQVVEALRQQILLLKNDLSFERYMVQQHLAHIGALRRSNMRQAVAEAETQSLMQANRALRHRLEEARKAEAQVRKEAEMSRNRAKNWEASLADRLRKLREEQKTWTRDEARLARELHSAQDESARLLVLLCEAEDRERKWQQDSQMLQAGASEMERLKTEVARLARTAPREKRALEDELRAAREAATTAENALILAQRKHDAREAEFLRARRFYQRQLAVLHGRLAEALEGGPRPFPAQRHSDARAAVESALAASRARLLDLQKEHARLSKKYTVLQSKMLEQQTSFDELGLAGAATGRGGNAFRSDISSVLSDPDTELSGGGGSGSIGGHSGGGAAARHRRRMPSETGLSDTTSPTYGSSSGAAGIRRPSTPTVGAALQRTETSGGGSPQADRYFGRGGVQNSGRKERKERKKDDPENKDKKAAGGGLRVMRGFM